MAYSIPPTYGCSYQAPVFPQTPFVPPFYDKAPSEYSLFTQEVQKFVKKANDLYRDIVKNGEPKVPDNKRYPTFTSAWNGWSPERAPLFNNGPSAQSASLFNYVDNSWNIGSRNNTTYATQPPINPPGRYISSEERTEREEKKEKEKTAAIWGSIATFLCVLAFGYNYARYQNINDDMHTLKNFETKLIQWKGEINYPNHPHLERIERIYGNTVAILEMRKSRLWLDVILTVSALAGSILIGTGGYLALHSAITAGAVLLTGTLVVAAGRFAYHLVRNDASREMAEEIHTDAMALKRTHSPSGKHARVVAAPERIIYYFDMLRWENERRRAY